MLRRARCDVPQDIALPGGGSLHPILGGSTLPWVLEGRVRNNTEESNHEQDANRTRPAG
jgi:hypothetical protein